MLNCFGGVSVPMGVKWRCNRCNTLRAPTGLCPKCRSPEFAIIQHPEIGDRVVIMSTTGDRHGTVTAVSHHADPRDALYACRMEDGSMWQAAWKDIIITTT